MAACLGAGVENFFPRDPDSPIVLYQDAAMFRRIDTLCSNCPVLLECFKSSMAFKDEFGIWAGIDRPQRLRMFRDLAAGNITIEELVAALAFRGPRALRDAYAQA